MRSDARVSRRFGTGPQTAVDGAGRRRLRSVFRPCGSARRDVCVNSCRSRTTKQRVRERSRSAQLSQVLAPETRPSTHSHPSPAPTQLHCIQSKAARRWPSRTSSAAVSNKVTTALTDCFDRKYEAGRSGQCPHLSRPVLPIPQQPHPTLKFSARQAGKPRQCTGRQAGKPRQCTGRQAGKPRLCTGRQAGKPRQCTGRHAGKPRKCKGRQSGKPQQCLPLVAARASCRSPHLCHQCPPFPMPPDPRECLRSAGCIVQQRH
jgi:hypothetical protein